VYLPHVVSPAAPTDWNYREWLQAVAAAFAALSAKLQASPLQLSYSGRAAMERGEAHRDIPAPPLPPAA
jgi:hypothetical protein